MAPKKHTHIILHIIIINILPLTLLPRHTIQIKFRIHLHPLLPGSLGMQDEIPLHCCCTGMQRPGACCAFVLYSFDNTSDDDDDDDDAELLHYKFLL